MSVKKVHDENVGYKVTNLGFQANQKIKNVTKPLEDEAMYDRPFESIAIVPAGQLDLMVGAVQPICVEATPAGANTPTIIWTSENPEFVQVRAEQVGMEVEKGNVTKVSDGVLTAVKKTTSPVTVKATAVKANGSTVTSSITVRVLDGTEEMVTLTVGTAGDGEGTVTPSEPVTVVKGDSVQVKATAGVSTFGGWYVGATKVSDETEFSYTVNATGELKAQFNSIPVTTASAPKSTSTKSTKTTSTSASTEETTSEQPEA